MEKAKLHRTQWATTLGFWRAEYQARLGSLDKLNWASADGMDHDGIDRRGRIAFVKPDEHPWLYELLQWAVDYHNKEFYRFKLSYIQPIQIHEYPEGGVYAPHHDWGGVIDPNRTDLCRKLTVVVQLSDPSEYEGGDLDFYTGVPLTEQERTDIRAKGTLVTFPGFVLHGVKPITRGMRYSLTAFCVGPDFQ